MDIVLFGVVFLGGIVGYIVGSVWEKTSHPAIKAGLAALGAIFTGAPIVFMGDLGIGRWLYPVGVVAGFFWSRIRAVLHTISRGQAQVGRSDWYLSIVEAGAVVLCTVLIAGLALMSRTTTESHLRPAEDLTAKEMPCRLAWIYLGRYSASQRRYEVTPSFSFVDSSQPRGPFPNIGDIIVITKERNLLVSGYGAGASKHRCAKMLDPPIGYRPETASQYVAGKILPMKRVLVNQLAYFPSANAEPTYVWALIGPPE